MKTKNLHFYKVTGEKENSFIGIKIIGNDVNFYYPQSYHINEEDFERDDLLDLLKTISLAKTESSVNETTNDERSIESDSDAFLSYVWIIEDYLQNGFYVQTNRVSKKNTKGKINWKKTIQTQKPLISGPNVVYSELISDVTVPQDTIITEAYRYCVKKSCDLIGWLYGISPKYIEIDENYSEQKKTIYLNTVRNEKRSTFDDNKQIRLDHMENVLVGLNESKDSGNSIVYGVDSYHYVYERMIDRIFGTEKIDDYYPRFVWHLTSNEDKKELAGSTIRPDTVMRLNNSDNIYIIDSKFYRYGSLDHSKTLGLPEAASIVKQITYGLYIKSNFLDNKEKTLNSGKVYNVFMLPFDSNSNDQNTNNIANEIIVYKGYVCAKSDKVISFSDRIYLFLIDLKYVVKTWNKMSHDKERTILINKIIEEEINIEEEI